MSFNIKNGFLLVTSLAVAVLPKVRRRGIARAVSSWLLARGAAAGARVAHLYPDSNRAARVYGRLAFVEAGGFDVYVDL